MSNNTGKIVDIREYRQKLAQAQKPVAKETPEGAVREMAHHMLMALHYAKQLLH